MKTSRKELNIGIALLIGFTAVLIGLFSPILDGQNPINYFDNLYNSISKGSVYYIPKLASESDQYREKSVKAKISFKTDEQAEEMLQIYGKAGLEAAKGQDGVMVSGNLGTLLSTTLLDSDLLFQNDGERISSKYGLNEKKVLYVWWLTLKGVEKELNNTKRFEDAKFVNSVLTKAVECAYNYYEIEPYSISDEAWFVIASLLFYVVYTLWFGYAIMYIFIGLGLKLEH